MDLNISNQTILDLEHSAYELFEFTSYINVELKKWETQFNEASYLNKKVKKIAFRQFILAKNEIENILIKVEEFIKILKSKYNQELKDNKILKLLSTNKILHEKLRISLSLFASVSTCLNWQSPSIKSSKNTRMGLEKYPIMVDYTDYKRDRSNDAFYCEKILQNTLFKTTSKIKPILNLCNCGMAAFTSVLYFLIGENIIKEKILASNDIYVENSIILNKFFKDKIHFFDFNQSDLIINKIIETEPEVIFMDTISNTFKMSLFDLRLIITKIAEFYKKEIYFIIDSTCSVGHENLLDDLEIPNNIKVIIHGSILKAAQLGMERVYAGFVLSYGLSEFECKILEYRTFSGCTLHDIGLYLLPFTSKELLLVRLKIIERNIINIANLFNEMDPDKEIISEVIYPGIKSHKDFNIVNKIGFAGPFFNIKFIKDFNRRNSPPACCGGRRATQYVI